MSNYRRLISYIYAYEGGVKGKNIGFAKIEIRNGQCRIHVNVKRVFLGNSDIGVYLLSPQKEILLGRIFIRNGVGEFRVNVNATNVENSGCGMDQCYGLTIHETESTWRTYTTIWEDAVTQAAEVELADVTAEKMKGSVESEVHVSVSSEIQKELEQEEHSQPEETEENRTQPEETVIEKKEISEKMTSEEVTLEDTTLQDEVSEKVTPEVSVSEVVNLNQEINVNEKQWQKEAVDNPEIHQKDNTDSDGWKRGSPVVPEQGSFSAAEENVKPFFIGNTAENNVMDKMIQQGRDSVSEKVLRIAKAFVQGKSSGIGQDQSGISWQKLGQISENNRNEYGNVRQETPVKQPVPVMKSSSATPPEPGDPAQLAELDRQEQEAAERGGIWTQMQRRYPKVLAFDYANGCEILSIKPQDIGILPRENWVYGNNSFLLHGYYNYRHLILAKLENPEGEPRYLLGVPGHYYSNEKNLAVMFGFSNFVLAKKQPEQDGRFGYWYTDLRL